MMKWLLGLLKGQSIEKIERAIARSVAARFSRGNVSIQAGRYVTRADLDREREDMAVRWASRH